MLTRTNASERYSNTDEATHFVGRAKKGSPEVGGWWRMAISFIAFAVRRSLTGWMSFVIFSPRLASGSIMLVKPVTFWSPASFTTMIEAKNTFQEALRSMVVMLQSARAECKARQGKARQDKRMRRQ